MVHPYLRRREGMEKPEYPRPELRAVLEKTLGVPLFQEQAMKVAIVGAGFTPAEADQLRRAMATFKFTGGVSHFYDKLVGGMVERGYPRDFAERTFKQIEGFGSYGFPESHAASFAKIAYASCWMKHHHPDVFCAALLNAQPMGFYAPAQIVRDAQRARRRGPARLHQRQPLGLHAGADRRPLPRRAARACARSAVWPTPHGAAIVAARGDAPFGSVEEVWRRAGVPRAAIEKLAEADAFHCARRRTGGRACGRCGGSARRRCRCSPPPTSAEALQPGRDRADVALTPMTDGREVVEDYRSLQLSLRAHPLTFLRDELARRGVVRCADLARIRDGRHVEVAGIILVRQKPGSRQGRAVHHDRGRDRGRQRHPVAGPVRGAAPHRHVGVDDRHEGPGAEERARSSTSSAIGSSIMATCCARSARCTSRIGPAAATARACRIA